MICREVTGTISCRNNRLAYQKWRGICVTIALKITHETSQENKNDSFTSGTPNIFPFAKAYLLNLCKNILCYQESSDRSHILGLWLVPTLFEKTFFKGAIGFMEIEVKWPLRKKALIHQ